MEIIFGNIKRVEEADKMTVIPIMIEMKGKKVIVVGGGRIAKRKLSGLVDSGAELLVISPVADPARGCRRSFHDDHRHR